MSRSPQIEKRALQSTVAVLSLVPVTGGLAGIVFGARFAGLADVDVSVDSHIRYLSGLLLGIGLAYLASIRGIEKHTARFRLLTAIVFIGGLGRLLAALLIGLPSPTMIFALAMELIVTPLVCLWQNRIAEKFGTARNPPPTK